MMFLHLGSISVSGRKRRRLSTHLSSLKSLAIFSAEKHSRWHYSRELYLNFKCRPNADLPALTPSSFSYFSFLSPAPLNTWLFYFCRNWDHRLMTKSHKILDVELYRIHQTFREGPALLWRMKNLIKFIFCSCDALIDLSFTATWDFCPTFFFVCSPLNHLSRKHFSTEGFLQFPKNTAQCMFVSH